MQRSVHIWKKLLRTATKAESKQVQDVTAFMSAKGSGEEKEKSREGGMKMEQPGGSGDAPSPDIAWPMPFGTAAFLCF